MLAVIHAPVIIVNRHRQSIKDRVDAAYDYEVNRKAEIAIMALNAQLDGLRSEQFALRTELLAASCIPR